MSKCTNRSIFGDKYDTAMSSITKIVQGGILPTDKAFMWIDHNRAAIFNYSVPYVRFFDNCVEVDNKFVSRGDTVTGYIFTGQEYTKDMLCFYTRKLYDNDPGDVLDFTADTSKVFADTSKYTADKG